MSKIWATRLCANWWRAPSSLRASDEERARPDEERAGRHPRPRLPARRVARERDRGDDERERDQAEERDPAFEASQLHSPSSRASAHRACSASSSSSPSACRRSAAAAPRHAGAGVAERDDRVALEPAWVVARDVEPAQEGVVEAAFGVEPADEVDVRGVVGRPIGAPPLHPAVPRADVLADVAAVDLRAERRAVRLRDRLGHLRPVREAPCGVEHAGLVERAGRARVDAARARAAAFGNGRRRLELGGGDERAEHDPGAVAARDQHRVLAVEPDAGASGGFAVDVLVRVDEDAVGRAELAAERVELLAQLGVAVVPGVARQPAVARQDARAPAGSSRARRRRRSRRRRGASRDGTRPPGARS